METKFNVERFTNILQESESTETRENVCKDQYNRKVQILLNCF